MAKNNNIKIGITVEIDGISNLNKVHKDIKQAMADINRIFDMNQAQLKFDFDTSGAEKVLSMLKSVRDVLKDINKLFDIKAKKINVELADKAIDKIKKSIETAFIEAMSKVREHFKKIAAEFAATITSSASTVKAVKTLSQVSQAPAATAPAAAATAGGARTEARVEKFSLAAGARAGEVKEIGQSLNRLKKDFRAFTEEFASLMRTNFAKAQELSGELGYSISLAFASSLRVGSQIMKAEIKEAQADVFETMRQLRGEINVLEVVQATPAGANNPVIQQDIQAKKQQLDALQELYSQYEFVNRATEDRSRILEKSAKIDQKAVRTQADMAFHLNQFSEMMAKIGQGDVFDLEKQVRPFELMTQSLRHSSQEIIRHMEDLRRQGAGAEQQIKELENQWVNEPNAIIQAELENKIAELQEFVTSIKGGTVTDAITGEQRAVEGLLKTYQDKLDMYLDYTAQVRVMADDTRMWIRVLNESKRVTENALKNAERLKQEFKVTKEALTEAPRKKPGVDLLTGDEYTQAIQVLKMREKNIKDINKVIAELENAAGSQMDSIRYRRENFKGEFAGMEGASQDALNKKEDELQIASLERINSRLIELKEHRAELIAMGDGDRIKDLEAQVVAVEKLKGLEDTYDKISDSLNLFNTGLQNISLSSNGSIADLKLQADAVKQFESEIVKTARTINDLETELAQLGAGGGPQTDELRLKIMELREEFDNTSKVFFDGGKQLEFASIKALAKELDGVAALTVNATSKWGDFQYRLQEAKSGLSGTVEQQKMAAESLKRLSNEGRVFEQEINSKIRALEKYRDMQGQLTAEEQSQLEMLKQLSYEFGKSSETVRILADDTAEMVRVAEVAGKATENAFKGAQKSVQDAGVVMAGLFKQQEMIDQKDKGSLFPELFTADEAAEAKNILAKREALIKQMAQQVTALEQARNQMIEEILARRQAGVGDFANVDPTSAEAEVIQADLIKKAAEDSKAQIDELKKSMNELNVSAADTVEALQARVEKFEAFDKIAKDSQQASEDLRILSSRMYDLSKFSADSTSSIYNQAENIKKTRSEYFRLGETIGELQRQLQVAGKEGGSNVRQLKEELEKLQEKQAKIGESFFSDSAQVQYAEIEQLAAALKEVDKTVASSSAQWGSFQNRMKEAEAALKGTSDEQLRGAQSILKMGTEAKSAEENVRKKIQTLEQLRAKTGSLNVVQKQQLDQLNRLANNYRDSAAAIAKKEWDLKRIEKASKEAGQGFARYNASLADSIGRSFQFIHAAGIITAALMGLRTAFNQMLEESKAFARTMTVMQSNSMTMAQTYEELKKTVRATAIEFGESIDNAAEIVKQFGSAGLTAEESMRGLNDTMKLIISTQGNAAHAARSVAGIYNVFGRDIAKAHGEMNTFARINDVIATVYRNHQVELDEMVQGLRYASSAGKVAGFQFEELSGYLAVLNDNLIKSGTAGRGLQAVFAQLGAKSDQIEKAFGFEFDGTQDLASQFIPLLEHMNAQLGSGVLTTEQLGDQFRIFGRLGARAFITLVQNVDSVREAVNKLKYESQGTADELAAIVKGEVAKQWETAKQSVLELARSGLEPLKELIIQLNQLIRSFTQGLTTLGIDKVVSIFGTFAFTVGILISSLVAVTTVMVTLMTKVKFSAMAIWSKVSATYALNRATAENTIITNQNAYAHLGNAKAMAAGGGRVLAAFKSIIAVMGGWPVIVTAAIIGAVLAIGKLNKSTGEFKREFESLIGELRQLNSVTTGLENFSREMALIEKQLERGGVAAEIGGQQIKQAFEEAGHLSISQASVIGKSNKEIFESRKQIIESVSQEIKMRRDLLAEQRENLRLSMQEALAAQTKSAAEGNFFNRIFRSSLGLASEIEAASADVRMYEESLADVQKRMAEMAEEQNLFKRIFNKTKNLPLLEGITQDSLDSAKEKATKNLREFANVMSGIQTQMVQSGLYTVEQSFVEIRGLLEKNTRLSAEYISKVMNELAGRLHTTINVDESEAVDAMLNTGELFYEIFKGIGPIVDQAAFNEVADRMRKLRDDVLQVSDVIPQFAEALGRDIENVGEGIVLDLDPENFRFSPNIVIDAFGSALKPLGEEVKNILVDSMLDAFGAGYDQLSQSGDGEIGFQPVVTDTLEVQGALTNIDRRLMSVVMTAVDHRVVVGETVDEYGRVQMSAQELANILLKVQDILGRQSPEIEESIAQLEEKRKIAIEEANAHNKTEQEVIGINQEYDSSISKLKTKLTLINEVQNRFMKYLKDNTELSMLEAQRNAIVEKTLSLIKQGASAQAFLNTRTQKQIQLQTQESRVVALELKGITQANVSDFIKKTVTDLNFTGDEEEMRKQLQEMMGKMEVPKELFDAVYAAFKLRKEIAIYDLQQAQNSERISKNHSHIRLHLKGQVREVSHTARMLAMSAKHTQNLMILEEKLYNGRQESAEAINEINEMITQIVEKSWELVEAVYAENEVMFSTLETIEQMLNAESKLAGIQFTALKVASKMNLLNAERKRIDDLLLENGKQSAAYQSAYIDWSKRAIDALKEMLDIEKKLKEIDEQRNTLLDNRLNLYKKILDFGKDQAKELEDELRSGLERLFETDKLSTAMAMADALGMRTGQVLANVGRATDLFIKGISQGVIDASKLPAPFAEIAVGLTKASAGVGDLQKELYDVMQIDKQITLSNLEKYLEAGNFAGAEKALNRFLAIVEQQYKDFDPQLFPNIAEEYRDALVFAAQINERLTGILNKDKKEILVSLGIEDEIRLSEVFDRVRETVQEIKKELIEISGIDPSDGFLILSETLSNKSSSNAFRNQDGIDSLRSSMSELGGAVDSLRKVIERYDRVSNSSPTAKSPIRRRTGGPVPGGYGGGDIVPALLEPGEFVIPKESVSAYGLAMMEDIRRGKLKGYKNGGLIKSSKSSGTVLKEYVEVDTGVDQAIVDIILKIEPVEVDSAFLDGLVKALSTGLDLPDRKKITVDDVKLVEDISLAKLDKAAAKIKTSAEIMNDAAKTFKDEVDKQKDATREEARLAGIQKGQEIIDSSFVLRSLFDGVLAGSGKLSDRLNKDLSFFLDFSFASQNAEALSEYRKQVEEINKQFREQFKIISDGLKRNETSYFDYLNALEDAERERLNQLLEAEKQYQEALIQTADIFKDEVLKRATEAFQSVSRLVASSSQFISEALFGNLEDNLKQFVFESSELFERLGEYLKSSDNKFINWFRGLSDGLKGAFTKLFEKIARKVDQDGTGILQSTLGSLGAAGKIFGNLLVTYFGAAISSIGLLMGGLFNVTQGEDGTVDFIEKFVEELPEVAVEFMEKMLENAERIVDAIAEAMPRVIEVMVEKIPEFIRGIFAIVEEAFPILVESLAKAIPDLVASIVPSILKMILTFVSSLTFIVDMLVDLPFAIISGILEAFRDPKFVLKLAAVFLDIIMLPFRIIWGVLTGFLRRFLRMDIPQIPNVSSGIQTFHTGGTIPGNYEDVLIVAQSGEGVLSRQGMKALGGAQVLDKINSGETPMFVKNLQRYHEGGPIGREQFVRSDSSSHREGGSYSMNNDFAITIKVDGQMSKQQTEDLADQLVDSIDKKLSKKAQDRDSKFSRSLR
jgi:TP901 family phage tail tape measure protein